MLKRLDANKVEKILSELKGKNFKYSRVAEADNSVTLKCKNDMYVTVGCDFGNIFKSPSIFIQVSSSFRDGDRFIPSHIVNSDNDIDVIILICDIIDGKDDAITSSLLLPLPSYFVWLNVSEYDTDSKVIDEISNTLSKDFDSAQLRSLLENYGASMLKIVPSKFTNKDNFELEYVRDESITPTSMYPTSIKYTNGELQSKQVHQIYMNKYSM